MISHIKCKVLLWQQLVTTILVLTLINTNRLSAIHAMEVYGTAGQTVSFSWTVDCALLGEETTAIFRVLAEVGNSTSDNDEYSVKFDLNWDDDDNNGIISAASNGDYKLGQKKVTKFTHTFTNQQSYATTFSATIIAPNQPSIHGARHTANYTIAISEVLCFATTGKTKSDTVLIPSNVFTDESGTAKPGPDKDADVEKGFIDTSKARRMNDLHSTLLYTIMSLVGLVLSQL